MVFLALLKWYDNGAVVRSAVSSFFIRYTHSSYPFSVRTGNFPNRGNDSSSLREVIRDNGTVQAKVVNFASLIRGKENNSSLPLLRSIDCGPSLKNTSIVVLSLLLAHSLIKYQGEWLDYCNNRMGNE